MDSDSGSLLNSLVNTTISLANSTCELNHLTYDIPSLQNFSFRDVQKILNKMASLAESLPGSGNTSSGGGCRVISALYNKKKFITFGVNSRKSNPFQARYGKNKNAIYFHAETNALKKAYLLLGDELLKAKTTLFIVRVKRMPNRNIWVWGLAKPCVGCLRAIMDMKINQVIYTEDEDFFCGNEKRFSVMKMNYSIL